MHPIITIIVNAVQDVSKIVVRAVEQLDNPQLSLQRRQKYVEKIANTVHEELTFTIKKFYPQHELYSEESAEDPKTPLWLINPISGIVNYSYAIPHFSMALAMLQHGKIQHSLIYDPIRQEMFTASKGNGATMNNRKMRVKENKNLENSVIACNTNIAVATETLRTGDLNLDLAYVAKGRLDGAIIKDANIINFAAGTLFVQEAGGLMLDFTGSENFLHGNNLVAGNAKIVKTLLQGIKHEE